MAKYKYQINPFTGDLDATAGIGGAVSPGFESGAITSNSLAYTLPAGDILDLLNFSETSGNAVTLNIGTTPGGSEIDSGIVVSASGEVNYRIQYSDKTSSTTIYINSAAWGGASIDVKGYLLRT